MEASFVAQQLSVAALTIVNSPKINLLPVRIKMRNWQKIMLAVMLVFLLVPSPLASQQPTTTTKAEQDPNKGAAQNINASQVDDETVVRIDTKLVQIDVLVTDKKGQVVTDLKPEDFEIVEDGTTQTINNFAFVSLEPLAKSTVTIPGSTTSNTPKKLLAREQIQRTLVLVVDDLTLPFDAFGILKRELKKFIEKQVQDNDLVALLVTSQGFGSGQQFTNDRKKLLAAVDKVRWNALGYGETSAFDSIRSNELGNLSGTLRQQDELRRQTLGAGTLNTLRSVVTGLRDFPGRKSLVLFSGGFRIFNSSNDATFNEASINDQLQAPVPGMEPQIPGMESQIAQTNPNFNNTVGSVFGDGLIGQLRQLVDLANRSSVVFYTIDARNQLPSAAAASDGFTGNGLAITNSAIAVRQRASNALQNNIIFSQTPLRVIAAQTGGKFNVSPEYGIRDLVQDQQGYYVVGYEPREGTFSDGNKRAIPYHRLKVKVKREGLQVRTRSGFYGLTDKIAQPVAFSSSERMQQAITSPFAANDLRVRLTPLVTYDSQNGTALRSLIYVDGRDLQFANNDGKYKATLDLLITALDEKGQQVQRLNRTQTIETTAEIYQKITQDGFAFIAPFAIQPGVYQLRAAIRDGNSDKIGSAGQVIVVDDVTKGNLVMSGLIVDKEKLAAEKNAARPSEVALIPAVRRFSPGTVIEYIYQLHNFTQRGKLQAQVKLLHDDQTVFIGTPVVLNATAQSDNFLTGGKIKLGANLAPGNYLLQVTIEEENRPEQTIRQVIDLEIAP
jgi:VWFA-related protein